VHQSEVRAAKFHEAAVVPSGKLPQNLVLILSHQQRVAAGQPGVWSTH
jgi:hypothetical protein